MGELLLCNEPIAGMPYYMEGVSVNLYSIEELCYYIANHTYMLERGFMCEELCTWLQKEVRREALAEHLRELLRSKCSLSEFVLAILKESGYCGRAEIRDIGLAIREMEEKTDFECGKIRADKLMECGKFLSSMYEYKRLLEYDGIEKEDRVLVGNIYHNLGTAYARLFLFEEAIGYYEKAYEYNHSEESKRQMLLSYQCMKDERGFLGKAQELGMNDTAIQALRNEIALVETSRNFLEFEDMVEELRRTWEFGDRKSYERTVNELILYWKNDYRNICRV